MKSILDKIVAALTSNLLLKIGALVFAVILWSYVITETNPSRLKTVSDVQISYINVDQLETKDLAISQDLDQILGSVDVTVSIGQKYVASATPTMLNATVDMSTINGTGSYELPIHVTSSTSLATVTGVSPSTVTVEVEDLVKRFIPVETSIIGQATNGYYLSKPTVSPMQIEVTGARSDVSSIAGAVCYINISDVTATVNSSYNLTLLDSNGEQVDDAVLKGSIPSAIVSMEVFKTKTVPIDLTSAVAELSRLPDGYEVTGVTVSPSTVTIAAEDEALELITAAFVEPISVVGATESISATTAIKSMQDVEHMSAVEAVVNIVIEPVVEERTTAE